MARDALKYDYTRRWREYEEFFKEYLGKIMIERDDLALRRGNCGTNSSPNH